MFIRYNIYGSDIFLVMKRPVISKQPIDLIYNYLTIYIYNIQYNRLYNIISFFFLYENRFHSTSKKQRFIFCIKIITTTTFYILIDCSKLVFGIITILIKVFFSNKKNVHIALLKNINSLIEESYTHKPKIKIILFIKNIGIRINPNKKDLFNQT